MEYPKTFAFLHAIMLPTYLTYLIPCAGTDCSAIGQPYKVPWTLKSEP